METKTKDLWVFIETSEDGSAKNVGLELLNPGRDLADKQGGKLVALVIGSQTEAAVQAAVSYGADKVLVVDGPEYKGYNTDAYTYAVCTFLYAYDKLMKIYIKIWKQSVARNKAKYISMVFYICVRGWPQI